jgi:hypothetical protein
MKSQDCVLTKQEIITVMQFVTFGNRNMQLILQVCHINVMFVLSSNGENIYCSKDLVYGPCW